MSLESTQVHLVRHVGDSDIEVVEADITYAEALMRITEDFDNRGETSLDIINVENGRFMSWAI